MLHLWVYMDIKSHINMYLIVFINLKYIFAPYYIFLHVYLCTYAPICVYMHIYVCFGLHLSLVLQHFSPGCGELPTTPRELYKTANSKHSIDHTLQHLAPVLYLKVQDNRGTRRYCKKSEKKQMIIQTKWKKPSYFCCTG